MTTMRKVKFSELLANAIADYFEKNSSKGDMAKIDYENEQLIIYEHDKDKEVIEKIKSSVENSTRYIC